MTELRENIYKISRNNSGLTQEQASARLGISPRTLSDYENRRAKVPDDVVEVMTVTYKTPLLAWCHLKNTSILGRFLPDVVMPTSNGDMAFQRILAHDDLKPIVKEIKRIMADGKIGDDEKMDFDQSIELLKQVNAKLLSVIIYAGKS